MNSKWEFLKIPRGSDIIFAFVFGQRKGLFTRTNTKIWSAIKPVMATNRGVHNYSNSDRDSGQMGPRPILLIKVPVTITVLNFGVGRCEQASSTFLLLWRRTGSEVDVLPGIALAVRVPVQTGSVGGRELEASRQSVLNIIISNNIPPASRQTL